MLATAPRPKKCRSCGERFVPARPLQVVCPQFDCVVAHVNATKAKREAREHRERKIRAKTRAQWLREAQASFNRFIRLRDAGRPCISCGRHHQGQWHAGHYLSVGARPELRFEELNVHAQCAPCNNHLSGNIVLYRQGLIVRAGIGVVEWLEGAHEPKKYTIDELRQIKAEYTSKARELEKNGAN